MSKQDLDFKQDQIGKEVDEVQKKKKTRGQSLVEYGLILALVSVVAITVLQTMGKQIKTTVNQVSNQLKQANEISQRCAEGTDC